MVYHTHYHHPNSRGGKISITKSLPLLFLSSLFINLGRGESGKQKSQEGWLGWSIRSSWWSVVTGPSWPKGNISGETLKLWLDCQIPSPSLLCKNSQLSRLQNSLVFSAASSFNVWPMQQWQVAIKRILNFFCLTCWNNLYRKLTPGSFWPVLITCQFRVHLWFLFTDEADFSRKKLDFRTLKSCFWENAF